ncbi:hypothetical protein LB465_07085 [Salegentibacter sp. LM13S]|uniref:hypothetical protein n=1 Tax=Salegentibacter lacus TaxID=2873599 RepID=UPI001CC9681F|nr:hypothetical protein [Salegentibacter lacus]MBZ9630540.1 hypothetical protein [Salegentibacter lacus]
MILNLYKLTYCFLVFSSLSVAAQELNYSHLDGNAQGFQSYLSNNDDYFSGGSENYPYYQGKINHTYIKFHKSAIVNVVINFPSQEQYLAVVKNIKRNANFNFKYCTDYNQPITYNYQTSSGNKIRFNFEEPKISIEYPSKTSSVLNRNFEFLPVFICLSDDAYAYHTNLRCGGIGNCTGDIRKTDIKGAKNNKYKICEICRSDTD